MAKAKAADGIFYGLKLNDEQKNFIDAIQDENYQVVFVDSPPGVGKTLLAVAMAKILVAKGEYSGARYIFTPCEENALGYTPGTAEEKEAKYYQPLCDSLIRMGEKPEQSIITNSNMINQKNGNAWIKAHSHTFARGSNYEKEIVICDELQNWRIGEISKTFSRCFDNSKIIALGSSRQIDIDPKDSGFINALNYFQKHPKCKVVEMNISYRGWIAEYCDGLI